MKVKNFILCLIIGLGLVGSAWADTLDFGMVAPTSGTVSYAGGSAALIGSGIQVDNVVLLSNSSTLYLSGGLLDFNTGSGSYTGSGTSWAWTGSGTGNSITLTGSAYTACTTFVGTTCTVFGGSLIASGTLLSGSFGTASITNVSSTFKIAASGFSDVKNTDLASYFGLPGGSTLYIGNFNLSFNTAATSCCGAFTSSGLLSGDLTNVPTPEPAAIVFLGTSLLCAGGLLRRRFRGKA